MVVLSPQMVVQPRGDNCSAVSELWYLEYPAGRGWGNHPDTPHRHTPNSAKIITAAVAPGGLGGLFPGPAVSSEGRGHCVLRRLRGLSEEPVPAPLLLHGPAGQAQQLPAPRW